MVLIANKLHYSVISKQIVNGAVIAADAAQIYIELYLSLRIHKVVDDDGGGRICRTRRRTGNGDLRPPSPVEDDRERAGRGPN